MHTKIMSMGQPKSQSGDQKVDVSPPHPKKMYHRNLTFPGLQFNSLHVILHSSRANHKLCWNIVGLPTLTIPSPLFTLNITLDLYLWRELCLLVFKINIIFRSQYFNGSFVDLLHQNKFHQSLKSKDIKGLYINLLDVLIYVWHLLQAFVTDQTKLN